MDQKQGIRSTLVALFILRVISSFFALVNAAMRKLFHTVSRIVCAFIAIVLFFCLIVNNLPDVRALLGFTHATTVSDTMIEQQLNAISDFATYEYTYTNHVDFANSGELLGQKVWLTEHTFSFDYTGTIKAGYDFSEIVIAEIDHLEQKVYIHLPSLSILDNEVSIIMDTYTDSNNLTNPLQPREVLEYLYSRRELEAQSAIEQGLYQLAAENAQRLIRAILDPFGYEVVFI